MSEVSTPEQQFSSAINILKEEVSGSQEETSAYDELPAAQRIAVGKLAEQMATDMQETGSSYSEAYDEAHSFLIEVYSFMNEGGEDTGDKQADFRKNPLSRVAYTSEVGVLENIDADKTILDSKSDETTKGQDVHDQVKALNKFIGHNESVYAGK